MLVRYSSISFATRGIIQFSNFSICVNSLNLLRKIIESICVDDIVLCNISNESICSMLDEIVCLGYN